jgi:hypothetical protein
MANEQLVAIYSQHTSNLNRVATSQGNAVIPYIDEIYRQINIVFANYSTRKRITPELEQKIRDEINKIVSTEMQAYIRELKSDQRELGLHEAQFGAQQLDEVIKDEDFTSTVPAAAQITAAVVATPIKLGEDSFITYNSMMRNYWQKWTDEIDAVVAQGFIQGQTIQQIQSLVLETIEPSKTGVTKSALDRARRSAKTIAITGTNHYANQARVAFAKDNEDVIKGYEFISVIDSRTSSQCFTGETTFHPIGELTRLYRAKYSGDIITLNLSTGEKISGTPNHPILTNDGWTPLNKVDPSKHIVYSVVNDARCLIGKEDVDMPTTFAEFFDSLSELPAVDRVSSDSSTKDFYGDGVRMNGKVNILLSKCHLRGDFVITGRQEFKNFLLRFCHVASRFFDFSLFNKDFFGWPPAVKTSKFTSGITKCFKKTGSGNAHLSKYFGWPRAIIKHFNSFVFGFFGVGVNKASWSALHEPDLLEKVCNSGCGDIVLPSDCGSANAITVKSTNIIGMSSEFRDCHVYTSECGQGYYTSGGIIVKNCRSLDGRVFKIDDPKLSQFTPPLHPNCRSALVYQVDERYSIQDEDSKRQSNFRKDGKLDPKPIDANQTYYEALSKLSAADQNAILGPTLGKAFRKLDNPSEFAKFTIDSLGQPLTIKQMKERDNVLSRILNNKG